MKPTSTSIINASRDNDLYERIVAVASMNGVANPEYTVQSLRRDIVSIPIGQGEDQTTIAAVYEYITEIHKQQNVAKQEALAQIEEQYPTPTPPGQDTSAVTDTHILNALTALYSQGRVEISTYDEAPEEPVV